MNEVTVPFQGRLPMNLVVDLQRKLHGVTEAHGKELIKIKDPAKLAAHARTARLLTINNIVRLAFIHGAPAVMKMSDGSIISQLSDIGIARGRPRTPTKAA